MHNPNALPSNASSIDFPTIVLLKLANEPSQNALEKLDHASNLLLGMQDTIASTVKAPILTVIIPAYNEAGTILRVVETVFNLDIDKQIIVIDDGSTDGTRESILTLKGRPGIDIVLHEQNQGKGAAIQTGIRLAKGDVLIVQDADLEYDPNEILRVIKPICDMESDVVYGSRYLSNTHQDQSFIHRFGNACLTGFSNLMTNQRLTDMETCYKAFRRELIQSISIEQRRFGFEPEITAKLARKKIVIREVAISYQSRSWQEGKKIGVRDLISTLWCIVQYRFRG